jgi:hypothetical protein
MKYSIRAAAIAAVVFVSQVALGGGGRVIPVPTLGEAGLLALAVGLAGGGVALIRRRRR